MTKKTNYFLMIVLMITSTIITTVSIFYLPSFLSMILPQPIYEILKYQYVFIFGHIFFLSLLTICIYSLVGCYVGIKTETVKDAILYAISIGLGQFLSLLLVGSFFAGAFIFSFVFQYFLFALPSILAVTIPALVLNIIHKRIKINKHALHAIASIVILTVYMLTSISLKNKGENRPQIDYMFGTPVYQGVKEQIVQHSEFQLEVDSSSGEDVYIGFGSFPAIGYCDESAILVSEFCHQHLNLLSTYEQYELMDNVTSSDVSSSIRSLINKRFSSLNMRYSNRFREMINDELSMDIAIFPRMPKDNYRDNDKILLEPIAIDALVFIVHKDNPVSDISSEELCDIYVGNIINWRDLGGDNLRIKNYQRNERSFTYKLMMSEVMQGTRLITPVQVDNGIGELVNGAYQNFPESIGFCLLSFLENDGFHFDNDYKVLSINGVYPELTNIRNGAYPYTILFYAAIRKDDENSNGSRFLDWILSDEGQKCVTQSGYISLRDN
ncbi:MAG: substrate-binding domain-containing protein [Oscillospiraceae bacterium]|nr:substrate-binding domain-containing protein [Oscillospiraceae bacterium]